MIFLFIKIDFYVLIIDTRTHNMLCVMFFRLKRTLEIWLCPGGSQQIAVKFMLTSSTTCMHMFTDLFQQLSFLGKIREKLDIICI